MADVLSFWACPKESVESMSSVVCYSSVHDQRDKAFAVP